MAGLALFGVALFFKNHGVHIMPLPDYPTKKTPGGWGQSPQELHHSRSRLSRPNISRIALSFLGSMLWNGGSTSTGMGAQPKTERWLNTAGLGAQATPEYSYDYLPNMKYICDSIRLEHKFLQCLLLSSRLTENDKILYLHSFEEHCSRNKVPVRPGRHYKRWHRWMKSAPSVKFRIDGRRNPPIRKCFNTNGYLTVQHAWPFTRLSLLILTQL